MEILKLNLNKDFRRIYGRGHCHVHPLLVTYIMRNKRGALRYGITTGKKVGCAVNRNRARRVIDAALKDCIKYIDCNGVDIVFVARSCTPTVKSQDVYEAMMGHFIAEGICVAGEK